MEAKEDFLAAGGKAVHYIPCLNEDPAWVAAMAGLVERHMAGWPTAADPASQHVRRTEAEVSRREALALGAAD